MIAFQTVLTYRHFKVLLGPEKPSVAMVVSYYLHLPRFYVTMGQRCRTADSQTLFSDPDS